MIVIAFCIGILLPALNGWLLVRLVEGKHPVLLQIERCALGTLAGFTGSMTLTFFLALLAHLPFSRWGFLLVQGLLFLLLLAAVRWRIGGNFRQASAPPLPAGTAPRWARALLVLLGIVTVAKIFLGSFLLVTTPPSFDDTVKNWDFRGKIFFVTQTVSKSAPGRSEDLLGQIASYPPALSLSKTWLAALAGGWNEGLVDAIQIVWFVALLVLLYALLRRVLPRPWAFLGLYLLVSLPLELIHGTQAYADVFLSAHLLGALALLFHAARAETAGERASLLRLSALFTALLPLVKNEGLVLYLPLLFLLAGFTLLHLRRRQALPAREVRRAACWYGGLLLPFVLPWLLYKWRNGLTFGNAHALSGTLFLWQPQAFSSMVVGLFFEGSWLLFFPLFAAVLVLGFRRSLRFPVNILTLFFLLALLVYVGLFTFTNLSAEAIYQTGFSRGIVHIAPIAVALFVILTHGLFGMRERE